MISFTHPWAFWALALVMLIVLVPVLARGRRWRATPARIWWSIALRTLIALALLFSLAGAQWVRAVDLLTVVYLVDLSDSIPASERERAEAFIGQSVRAMPPNGQAAIVAFGENALVERLPSTSADMSDITSVPVATRTNIAAAIRLGLALFPEASRKRMVILSDGIENVERAIEQADLAVAHDVEISYVPLRALQGETEAYLDRLEMPGVVRLGQRFELTAIVESTVAQPATLQLFADGALARSLNASLQPGTNRVRASLTAEQAGFRRYRAELIATNDTLPQNNLAAGFTVVQGPPRILLIEGKPGEAGHLAAASNAAACSTAARGGQTWGSGRRGGARSSPSAGAICTSSGSERNTGPCGGVSAACTARRTAEGRSSTRPISAAHLVQGRTASTIRPQRIGSSNIMRWSCWPAVRSRGVLERKAL